MDIIYYLKGLAEGYAHQSQNSEFEVQHLMDVEKAVLMLCHTRNLSVEKGLIMAYSHDLGRLKEGVTGKVHSKVSGKILKELLKNKDFSKKEVKSICKSVRHHNQKEKIHDAYSELIKDADSLAHGWEGLVERDDFYEQVRVLAAVLETPKVQGASQQHWQAALEKAYSKIVKCVNDEIAFSAQSEFWVHDLRVAIRKTRSILWILKQQKEFGSLEELRDLDARLEKMAKALEYVRILQVALGKVALNKKTYKDFQRQVTAAFLNMGQQYDKLFSLEGLETQLEKVMAHIPQEMENACQMLLFKTFKLARSVDLSRSKKLHALRIYTKRIKYLSQMGLIDISTGSSDRKASELLEETFLELNDLLGDLHDIHEFNQLLGKHIFSDELQVLKMEAGKRLFLVNKMSHLDSHRGGIL